MSLYDELVTARVAMGLFSQIMTLDATSDVDLSPIGGGVVPSMAKALNRPDLYQGTWNAHTNTPALASSVGTPGWNYTVSNAGSTNLDGIKRWHKGDVVVFHDGHWKKISGSDDPQVAGQSTDSGAVTSVDLILGYNGLNNTTGAPLVCNLPPNAAVATIVDGDVVILKDEGLNASGTQDLRATPASGTIEGATYLSVDVAGGWRKVRWSSTRTAWFQCP